MPFNPIANSVKDIQEAYQNGEIDKEAVKEIALNVAKGIEEKGGRELL